MSSAEDVQVGEFAGGLETDRGTEWAPEPEWSAHDHGSPERLAAAWDHVQDLPSLAPHLAVRQGLRDALIDWRPILGECRGLTAMVQLLLYSTWRDHVGVAVDYKSVYRSFGLTPDQGRRAGVSAATLLHLYRERVDATFAWADYSAQRHLVRRATTFSFPETVYEAHQLDVMDAARDPDATYVRLITGKRANRAGATEQLHDRRAAVDGYLEEATYIPETARVIASYANRQLDVQHFSHTATGIITSALSHVSRELRRLSQGADGRPAWSEHQIAAAEGALVGLRTNPMPLYLPCAHSPRLRADRHNQLMNLQSDLRRAFYTERDIELDLDKAHLASFCAIARRFDLDPALIETVLRPGGTDLWDELAARMDADVLADPVARRKAAKTLYAVVFGADRQGALLHMAERYAEVASVAMPSQAAFHGALDHPVAAELLRLSGCLLAAIQDAGGMSDAEGRWIAVRDRTHKDTSDGRCRSVLAYVAASYEQVLVAEVYREATREMAWAAELASRRPRWIVWLYQADGVTIRVARRQDPAPIIRQLQQVVEAKAREIGLITRLSVTDLRAAREPANANRPNHDVDPIHVDNP